MLGNINRSGTISDTYQLKRGEPKMIKIAKATARYPFTFLGISIVVTLIFSLIAFFFGNFEFDVNISGWESRGTLISKRQLQIFLVGSNRDKLYTSNSRRGRDRSIWDTLQNDGAKVGGRGLKLRLTDKDEDEIQFDLSCNIMAYDTIMGKENLIIMWKTDPKKKFSSTSVLQPSMLYEICKAEEKTTEMLEKYQLCYGCDNKRCLPPHSLVLALRVFLKNVFMSCETMIEAYTPDVQESFTTALAECADYTRSSSKAFVKETSNITNCPIGFGANLVDETFSSLNPTIRYTSSIYLTGKNNARGIYGNIGSVGRTESDLISGVYDTTSGYLGHLYLDDELKFDLFLAMCSAVITAIFIFLHTKSLIISLMGIMQIIFSIPLAYFCYTFIFGIEFFPILNYIGIFVVFALGAADTFVAVDKWKNVRLELKEGSTEEVASKALPDAAGAMLLTTMTTAVAFFATSICPVPPVRCFAIFCGLLIIFDYILNVLFIFPTLCIYDKCRKTKISCFFKSCPKFKVSSHNEVVGLKEAETGRNQSLDRLDTNVNQDNIKNEQPWLFLSNLFNFLDSTKYHEMESDQECATSPASNTIKKSDIISKFFHDEVCEEDIEQDYAASKSTRSDIMSKYFQTDGVRQHAVEKERNLNEFSKSGTESDTVEPNIFQQIFSRFPDLKAEDECDTNSESNVVSSSREDEDVGCNAKDPLISRILSRYHHVLHVLRWPLFILCIVTIAVCLRFAMSISLPSSVAEIRLLPESSEFTKHGTWKKNLLSSSLQNDVGSQVIIVWGLQPGDTGVPTKGEMFTKLLIDKSFDPSSYESQNYFVNFCDRLFGKGVVSKPSLDYECPINSFDKWLQQQHTHETPDMIYSSYCANATSLPMAQEAFATCFITWGRQYDSDESVFHEEGIIRMMYVQGTVGVERNSPYRLLHDEWTRLERWFQNERENVAPIGMNKMYHSSFDFWWYDTSKSMIKTAVSSATIAVIFSMVVVFVSSWSPMLTIFSGVAILYVLVAATTTMVCFGWELGFIEAICFAILIGISCDYVIHLSHAYNHYEGQTSRSDRTKFAIVHMGPSILASSATTLAASAPMLFCEITFFQKFATVLFTTVVHATIGSLVVFLVLTEVCGPKERTRVIEKLSIRTRIKVIT